MTSEQDDGSCMCMNSDGETAGYLFRISADEACHGQESSFFAELILALQMTTPLLGRFRLPGMRPRTALPQCTKDA